MSITEEEIIKEILAVVTHEGDQDSFTTTELSDAIGLSGPTVRKKLRVLWNAGRLESTQKRITGIDGRSYMRSAYRLLPQKETQDEGTE
tara:strand:+ start:291 stop:557 length:267 start_codon:yes stop_codon:yes gene_type:complete